MRLKMYRWQKQCAKHAYTRIGLCYTLTSKQPGADYMDTFLVLGVSSSWKNSFNVSLRKLLLFGACCSLPPKRLLHWSQQWQVCCSGSSSAWEPVAPPLVRTEGNSLGYMKEHKWQLLLKGKTAVYKLRCTVCPQQGQIWRVDCKYPKYHRGLMQTDGVLPLASFCKGKGQDFILHVYGKKHALISWITIFVK